MLRHLITRVSLRSLWHRPPVLRSKDSTEPKRHASWLELFFDLVFVVAIAELAHHLHDHLSLQGIFTFAVLFVPVWWLWIDFSYYGDQFDTDDVPYHVAMFAAMFGVVVLANFLPETFTGSSFASASIYLALRLIILALYVRAWCHVPSARPLTTYHVTNYTVAVGLWFVSLFVPEPYRYGVWLIAILLEILTGPVAYLRVKPIPKQVSHMDERFGLFTIIVLGESIVAVATGTQDTAWQLQSVVVAATGFITAVCLWWLYFDWSNSSAINTALRSNQSGLLKSFVYGYGHLFVYGSIAASSVGLQVAIESANEGLSFVAKLLAGGGLALFLIGLTVIHEASPGSFPTTVALARAVITVLVFGFCMSPWFTPVTLAFSVTCLFVVLVVVEFPYTARGAKEEKEA
ncbi:MAG: low temperature requirement protein A [Trueperaceae bacterium]